MVAQEFGVGSPGFETKTKVERKRISATNIRWEQNRPHVFSDPGQLQIGPSFFEPRLKLHVLKRMDGFIGWNRCLSVGVLEMNLPVIFFLANIRDCSPHGDLVKETPQTMPLIRVWELEWFAFSILKEVELQGFLLRGQAGAGTCLIVRDYDSLQQNWKVKFSRNDPCKMTFISGICRWRFVKWYIM